MLRLVIRANDLQATHGVREGRSIRIQGGSRELRHCVLTKERAAACLDVRPQPVSNNIHLCSEFISSYFVLFYQVVSSIEPRISIRDTPHERLSPDAYPVRRS
jgi:hypothetical protein